MNTQDDWFVCSHCGEVLSANATFCRHCGSSDQDGWQDEMESDFDEDEYELADDQYSYSSYRDAGQNSSAIPLPFKIAAFILLILFATMLVNFGGRPF